MSWDGGSGLSTFFDGSDVGLSNFSIDAFAVLSSNEVLLSFTAGGVIAKLSVDDSDIVRFTATSLGENTSGSFSVYFDGSDVGLTTIGEDVDAIEVLPNGNLLLSTTGDFAVDGLTGGTEDILEFASTSLGSSTSGSWSAYFDGSDVDLATQNVDGLAVEVAGDIYLSTSGNFSVPGLSGADEDVFLFTPSSLGSDTSGTYNAALYFDGSSFGLGPTDITAIDLP